ncbi:hypothetical protein LCGC14_1458580 [marine sediment metagenome]|uniref:Uncharacterized protein n=1 Tax=marine sediment metagenome TaxID=412755 RepID=A0A0F9K1W1_9ZZZZ
MVSLGMFKMDEWILITCKSCNTMNSVKEDFIINGEYNGKGHCHNLICKKSLKGAKKSRWGMALKNSHNYGKFKQGEE